jgi:phage baseplate assembly protein W
MPTPIGLTMPFMRATGSTGFLAWASTELEATYYNMKSLVLTNWGERPNHYYLGCNLIEFLFEPGGEETDERISERIRAQVAQWLPYVQLNSVLVNFSGDQHRIKITIDFGIRDRQDLRSVLVVSYPAGA